MDLFQDWQTLQEEKFNQAPIDKSTIMESLQINSQDILSTLNHRLRAKLYWGAGFLVVSTVLFLFSLQSPVLLVACGILLAIFLLLFGMTAYQVSRIRKAQQHTDNTLNRLRVCHRYLTQVMRLESLMSLLLVPISALAGQVAGYFIGGGSTDTLSSIFSSTRFLQVGIVVVLFLTPLGVWLTNWLNKKAFAPLLQRLKVLINELEALD